MSRPGWIVALVCGALLSTAAGALASRSPTSSERRQIVRAVKHSRLTRGVPASHYAVGRVRISTLRRDYAGAHLAGIGRYRTSVQPVDVLLRHTASGWHAYAIGGDLNCSGAPRGVMADLGIACVPGPSHVP